MEKKHLFRNSDILSLALITLYIVMALKKRHIKLPIWLQGEEWQILTEEQAEPGEAQANGEEAATKRPGDFGLRNDHRYMSPTSQCHQELPLLIRLLRLLTSRNSLSLSHISVIVDISFSTFVPYVWQLSSQEMTWVTELQGPCRFLLEKMFKTLWRNEFLASTWPDYWVTSNFLLAKHSSPASYSKVFDTQTPSEVTSSLTVCGISYPGSLYTCLSIDPLYPSADSSTISYSLT